MRCFSYSFPKSFDTKRLLHELKQSYKVTKYYDDVAQYQLTDPNVQEDEGNIFIFSYGAVITWGLTEHLEQKLIKQLNKFLGARLGEIDIDTYSYGYGESFSIKDDHITLPGKQIINKLACSHGLAQSVKLGGFEFAIQDIFDSTKVLPETLAKYGTIKLSRFEIRRLIGKIFIARTSINLHLELLDMPNFFWENTNFEPIHNMIIEYMSQKRRVEILNQKLVMIHDMLDMLSTELNTHHSSKLEWTVIILIGIELLVSVMAVLGIGHPKL